MCRCRCLVCVGVCVDVHVLLLLEQASRCRTKGVRHQNGCELSLSLNEGKRQHHPPRSQLWQPATTHTIQFLDFFSGHHAHLPRCQVEHSHLFKMTASPFPWASNNSHTGDSFQEAVHSSFPIPSFSSTIGNL